jgi:hypothetical protein
MKRFAVVLLASIAIVASAIGQKYAAAGLVVGIVVGTWFFLKAIAVGGGLAQARIARDPTEPRKPVDPNGSIGMGLAAAGIALAVIRDPDYAPYKSYFVFFFVAGLIIALAYAGKPVITELRRRQVGDGKSE